MTDETPLAARAADRDASPADQADDADEPDGYLLAIDIGNTSVAIGVFDGSEEIATFRVASDQDNFPDEYAMLLLGLLRIRLLRLHLHLHLRLHLRLHRGLALQMR